MELVGQTIGNYRIDRLLGEGGMGAVYLAHDISLQREVAIKLVHPHLARQPGFRERFIHEARIMAHFDHPGIVRVYHLGVEKELLYLPMEFIKGGNLRQLLDRLIAEKKWLPLHEAVLLLQQLCQTVEYAHQKGVLHRDIKPANLMLKPEPADGLPFRIVLTDLGLAKLTEGLALTQEGTSLGTPAYMSPEQSLGQSTDARSDVYSLGILLYELAVGRLPFLIRTLSDATHYHTQVPPPAPSSINPNVPESLERVILKALEKDRTQRYPSAAALGVVLAGVLSFSTEIAEPASNNAASLVTEYQKSIVEPPIAAASPMTMLENASKASRGESVFAGQTVAPGTETRIQIIQRERTAKVLPLPEGTVTIGREPGNHIVLDDTKASRKHAQITWDGMDYHIMDLNSRNGTFLDNSRLLPGVSEVWGPDQILRIGDSWLRLIRAGSKAPSVGAPVSNAGNTALYTSSSAGIIGATVSPQQLSVEPGGSVSATISVINQSSQVDHFSFSIAGVPSAWITSLPSSTQLMPGQKYEADFTLTVPRVWQSRVGPHTPVVRVSSLNDPKQFVEKKLTLTVAPYSQYKAELNSAHLRPGQMGNLTVANQGNLSESFDVQFLDPAGELRFEPPNMRVSARPGEAANVPFQARPRKPRVLGAQTIHPFTAKVSLPQGEHQVLHADVTSRGLFPVWVPAVILLLCCFSAILVFRSLPAIFSPTPTLESGAPIIDWCIYPSGQRPSSFANCSQVNIVAGQTVTIEWNVSNAEQVIITPLSGIQAPSGIIPAYPITQTTTFTIEATNNQQNTQAMIQVNVSPANLTSVTPTFITPETPTHTPTSTLTNTPTNTPTNMPTNTPTNTPTHTPTNFPTNTALPADIFDPQGTPLSEWRGIPIMEQAVAGQEFTASNYSFRLATPMTDALARSIEDLYRSELLELGWDQIFGRPDGFGGREFGFQNGSNRLTIRVVSRGSATIVVLTLE